MLASQGAEADDDLRRLEEVVPSGALRDDGGQVPSREGRSEIVWYVRPRCASVPPLPPYPALKS